MGMGEFGLVNEHGENHGHQGQGKREHVQRINRDGDFCAGG